jgi:hypothetical protein
LLEGGAVAQSGRRGREGEGDGGAGRRADGDPGAEDAMGSFGGRGVRGRVVSYWRVG